MNIKISEAMVPLHGLILIAALVLTTLGSLAQAQIERITLDTLNLDAIEQGWGKPGKNVSVDGNPLTIAGKTYPIGIGTHAHSSWRIALHGNAMGFVSLVGVDDEIGAAPGSVVFVVRVDDKEKYRSPIMHPGDDAQSVHVPLVGAHKLELLVEEAGDSINYDHADWAQAAILLKAGTKKPRSIFPERSYPPIAMGTPSKPAIVYPRITGATPGKPFLFRIPTVGTRPIRFEADGLPDGLYLDADTGIITGSLSQEGSWDVGIVATNQLGEDESVLTIVSGPDALARTPPMGWNSWNSWAGAVDDAKVRAAADWMVRSGLADHGYTYINIDDTWEGQRDDEGYILTNDKFPDMKALADYVHSKGLKLGIYSSPGPKTCARYEGSYEHETQDAQQYAAWGIDYLKYDLCAYRELGLPLDKNGQIKPYMRMGNALLATDRDIIYSLCQYGMVEVWTWGKLVHGNLWRTTGDIRDTWPSMSGIGFSQAELAPFAEPGHWNDPDMLVVGRVGWGPELHDSKLTPDEQRTHITLWCMLSAPLLIGADLAHLDPFTLALLTNDDVLAVNQDPLGKQARRVAQEGKTEVWVKDMEDGSIAVALFNRDSKEQLVEASWERLHITGPQRVRNLWQRLEEGTAADSISAVVSRHGAALYRLWPME